MTAELDRVHGLAHESPVRGHSEEPAVRDRVALPRLTRFRLTLASGAVAGVAVSGSGVPLVVVHGFAGEGVLYAQTLSRLVGMGFRVIAVDSPGHGGTDSVGLWADISAYCAMLAETLDHLGVRRAVLVGHSMGGRLVTELAAHQPERVLGVVLVDAIVGDVWDRMVDVFRLNPALVAGFGVGMVADSLTTLPLWDDPRQALKLARLVFPTGANHVRRPWRLFGPMLSILAAPRSAAVLERLAAAGLPTWLVHGDRDLLVPLCTAAAAAQRCKGTVVRVHGARHSWLLSDPETFPAIMAELLASDLGAAIAAGAAQAGGAPHAGLAGWEGCFVAPDALVAHLAPPEPAAGTWSRHRAPRYRWSLARG